VAEQPYAGANFPPTNPIGPAPLAIDTVDDAPPGWVVFQRGDELRAVMPGTRNLERLRAELDGNGRRAWHQVL
jgi:hypothetical protein